MSPPAGRRALFAFALALGLGSAWGAWRAWRGPEPAQVDGAFADGDGNRARALLTRLVAGLAALQEADGGFAPWAPADRPSLPEPEVQRTASTALAAWALVEAARQGVRLAGGDLAAVRDRALAHLALRQGAPPGDGSLGRMPRNPLGAAPDRRAEVTALGAAVIAWSRDDPRRDALLLTKAARMLGQEVRVGVRNGWMRALVAMAIDALLRAGRTGDLGPQPQLLLPMLDAGPDPDCGDFRVAEAMVRTLRGEPARGDAYPDAVLRACTGSEPPTWNGQASDTASWLMQAWLAARSRGAAPWFAALLTAVDEALGPQGWVPGGMYADRVAQTACAALAICQGLDAQVVGAT